MKKAASLQDSLSCENESNPTTKLDQFNVLPLSFGQGLRTLNAATMTVNHGFFVPLFQFLIGRGGAVQYKSGLAVKAARLSFEVLNTLAELRSSHLRKQNGEHIHA